MSVVISLLENLPVNLRASQQVSLTTAVFAHYSAVIAHKDANDLMLQQHAKFYDDEFKISHDSRFRIFSFIWSIIDNLDLLYQTIKADKLILKPSFVDKELEDTLKVARRLRNYKSHLDTNIRNLSSYSKYAPTLGVIRCFIVDPREDHSHGGNIYMLYAEPPRFQDDSGKTLKPTIFHNTTGAKGTIRLREFSFSLETHKEVINVTHALFLSEKFFNAISERWKNTLEETRETRAHLLSEPQNPWAFRIRALDKDDLKRSSITPSSTLE